MTYTKAQLTEALPEITAKIEALTKMSLVEYALSFGGLIVPDELLVAYKAEYLAKLTKLAAEAA